MVAYKTRPRSTSPPEASLTFSMVLLCLVDESLLQWYHWYGKGILVYFPRTKVFVFRLRLKTLETKQFLYRSILLRNIKFLFFETQKQNSESSQCFETFFQCPSLVCGKFSSYVKSNTYKHTVFESFQKVYRPMNCEG